MKGMTGRNQDAIKKTTAGLLKLIYPHRTPESMTRDEISPLIVFSVEMRKRVIDQLAVMKPEEFRGVDFQSLEVVCPQEPRIGA
jgi:predicted ATP-dependent Lon-type protease